MKHETCSKNHITLKNPLDLKINPTDPVFRVKKNIFFHSFFKLVIFHKFKNLCYGRKEDFN